MTKLPFSVSARTARLIGRENVSNADGAITELVKNAYDADATNVILLFNRQFSDIPERINSKDFLKLSNHVGFPKDCFQKINGVYHLSALIGDKTDELKVFFKSLYELFIIDNGTGMTEDVIKNNWMIIGTDNKLEKHISPNNRVQTGAKGIGRFALDRLGNACELLTSSKEDKNSYRWYVNWDNFENKNTSIDKVYANFESINDNTFVDSVKLPSLIYEKIKNFQHGTILKISGLRDSWNSTSISNIFNNLKLLTPPGIFTDFDIFVYDSLEPKKYGLVNNFINDDYDYQIKAKLRKDNIIELEINRSEFNFDIINKLLFKKKGMKEFPYNQATFKKGSFKTEILLENIIPGFNNFSLLEGIGEFQFNFYFLKRLMNTSDKKVFFYKEFNSTFRRKWMNEFGGIKIYRDKFKIRPYGDPGQASFDWLSLGERATKSPAGFAQRKGGFRVRPYQIAGEVHISRLTNINFEDKSSREGLQETKHFKLFKAILTAIIAYFEHDREHIGINMKELFKETNKDEEAKNDAQNFIKQIKQKETLSLFTENIDVVSEQRDTLAKGFEVLKKENKELLTELKLLRTLASSGLLITTFAHELRQVSSALSKRARLLKISVESVLDKNKLKIIPEYRNPFLRIQRLKVDDAKIKNWVDFSINAVKKNKRDKVKLNIVRYLTDYTDYWNEVISFKQSKITIISKENEIYASFFPIDIDSIFNNLLANSITAFLRKDASELREIKITLNKVSSGLEIIYEDSGPGLNKSIKNPDDIFDLFFTTKMNEFGEKDGTGLGLWIVKSTIKEYKGSVSILESNFGFKLQIILPFN